MRTKLQAIADEALAKLAEVFGDAAMKMPTIFVDGCWVESTEAGLSIGRDLAKFSVDDVALHLAHCIVKQAYTLQLTQLKQPLGVGIAAASYKATQHVIAFGFKQSKRYPLPLSSEFDSLTLEQVALAVKHRVRQGGVLAKEHPAVSVVVSKAASLFGFAGSQNIIKELADPPRLSLEPLLPEWDLAYLAQHLYTKHLRAYVSYDSDVGPALSHPQALAVLAGLDCAVGDLEEAAFSTTETIKALFHSEQVLYGEVHRLVNQVDRIEARTFKTRKEARQARKRLERLQARIAYLQSLPSVAELLSKPPTVCAIRKGAKLTLSASSSFDNTEVRTKSSLFKTVVRLVMRLSLRKHRQTVSLYRNFNQVLDQAGVPDPQKSRECDSPSQDPQGAGDSDSSDSQAGGESPNRTNDLVALSKFPNTFEHILFFYGRFKRSLVAPPKRKLNEYGLVDRTITTGASLAKILPSELARLHLDATRLSFLADLANEQLVSYSDLSSNTLPIILCLDMSGSMMSVYPIAAGFCLAMATSCLKASRPFALIQFDSRPVVLSDGTKPPDKSELFQWLVRPSFGGTSFDQPLSTAWSLAEANKWQESQLILITDGAGSIGEQVWAAKPAKLRTTAVLLAKAYLPQFDIQYRINKGQLERALVRVGTAAL